MVWHSQDGMGWWMLFGATFWLVFLISMAVIFARAFGNHTHHDHGRDREDPMDMARNRLARGEITTAEFDEIARRVQSPASPETLA